MKKQYIIPIFVPHLGCPNDCVFCNQKSISGQKSNMTKEKAKKILQTHSQNIIQAFYKSEDVKKLMDYLKFGLHNMKDIEKFAVASS